MTAQSRLWLSDSVLQLSHPGFLNIHRIRELARDIFYRSKLRAQEGKVIQDQGWEEHELRVLDVSLLLNCLKGCLLQIRAGFFQIKVSRDHDDHIREA